jgi:hypothetical protein
MKVPTAVEYALEEFFYHKSPIEVNNGWCIELARAVESIHKADHSSSEVRVTCCEIDGYDVGHRRWGGHWWIYDPRKELHYDAERPSGIGAWKHFPFFIRRLRKVRQPLWE